jgi:hypothetical protein
MENTHMNLMTNEHFIDNFEFWLAIAGFSDPFECQQLYDACAQTVYSTEKYHELITLFSDECFEIFKFRKPGEIVEDDPNIKKALAAQNLEQVKLNEKYFNAMTTFLTTIGQKIKMEHGVLPFEETPAMNQALKYAIGR